MFTTIFFTVLIILVIVLAISTIKIVKQSEVIIVERLGKYKMTGESGLNIVVPILYRVVRRIDLRTQVIDSSPQAVITKDNVTVDNMMFVNCFFKKL